MNVRSYVRLLWLPLVLWMAVPVAADWRVWTVAETRRVLREDLPGAQDTLPVKLAAAGNEWESFQILVRAEEPVTGIRVEAGELRGPNGAVLPATAARLYRQHALHLTDPSYRNDQFKPGWYPDPLIPVVHPLTGKPLTGARFTALPFDLLAKETHGFWIDLYVPANAQPGEYRGTYRVTAAGGKACEVPVALTVWDFQLPATPTMQTALGSPVGSMRSYYRKRAQNKKEAEPTDWKAVELQCAQMLSEHRINATPWSEFRPVAQADGTYRIPEEQVRAMREFIDRYHVNAIQVAHPRSVIKDPVAEQDKLRAWLAAWDRAAKELDRPQVTLFTYLLDEPNDEEAYRYVQKWGKAVRAAKSAYKVMVVEQTKTSDPKWGDLYGAVDIWCPLFPLHDPETAAQRLALGEKLWTYTALCQGKKKTPWWETDFPLLNYRVPSWMAWGQQMCGLLYWGGLSYWSGVDDPWTDPKTLDRRKTPKSQLLYNGEGSLVYPGRAVGYDGIASSLRLKALRDSIEDYEYLAILDRQGKTAEARKIVLGVTESFFQWNPEPKAYQEARAKLAQLIVAGGKK